MSRLQNVADALRAVAEAATRDADEAQRLADEEAAFLDPAPAPAPAPVVEAPAEPVAEAPVEMPAATPAAIAHADETGVDLTQVEGSGVDGTILKADVAAVAAADPSVEETAADVNAPEAAS